MKPPGCQRCTDTGCLDPSQGRAQLTEEERRRVSARMRARMRRALSREDPHVGNRRDQDTGCRGPTIRWGVMTAELVVPTRRVASAPGVQVGRIIVPAVVALVSAPLNSWATDAAMRAGFDQPEALRNLEAWVVLGFNYRLT